MSRTVPRLRFLNKSLSSSSFVSWNTRTYATHQNSANFVKIVECGARDGLQNEPGIVDVTTKVLLIEKLGKAGLKVVESGAMVSKKAVPQVNK